MPPPFFQQLLEIVLPRSCLGCGQGNVLLCARCGPHRPMPGRCAGCRSASPGGLTHPRCRARTTLQGSLSLSAYADPLTRRALLAAKYRGVVGYAEVLGARLGAAWLQVGLRKPGSLVPIPLHWTRERARGFNQAMVIAKGFSRCTGLPVLPCLRRNRITRPQSDLADPDRIVNVASAFTVDGTVPRRVILVDDIATSGATLETAAQALAVRGCEYVEAVVVATEL